MSDKQPSFAIIIPARFASTRFPGKPLAPLRGATGEVKSLLRRSWECARAVTGSAGVWIATDDDRVAEAATAFGAQVVMTSSECRNGTERCADAIRTLGEVAEIIVNLQGDAPLTPDYVVSALVEALATDSDAAMTTPAIRCSASLYDHLATDQAEGRVGGTTVAFNGAGKALYFSKRLLPHIPDRSHYEAVHLHLGVYAYRPAALAAYAAMPPSALEQLEGLEQLRFLEADRTIKIVRFDPIGWDCIELNNPEDTAAIERVLQTRGIV